MSIWDEAELVSNKNIWDEATPVSKPSTPVLNQVGNVAKNTAIQAGKGFVRGSQALNAGMSDLITMTGDAIQLLPTNEFTAPIKTNVGIPISELGRFNKQFYDKKVDEYRDQQYTGIQGLKRADTFLPTAIGMVAEQAPMLAGSAIGAAGKVGKAQQLGTMVGAAIPGFIQQGEYTSKIDELQRRKGQLTKEDYAKTLLTTAGEKVVDAALEAIPAEKLLGKIVPKNIQKGALNKTKQVLKDTFTQAALEGAQEVAQEGAAIGAENILGIADNSQNGRRLLESGIGGFVTGGFLGGGASTIGQFNGTNSMPEINGIYNEIRTKLEQAGIDTQTVEAQAEIGRQVENVLVDKYGQDAVNLLKERDLQLNVNDNANFEKRVSGEIIGQNTGKIIDEGSTPVEEQQNKGNFFSNVIQSFNDFINQPTAFDKLREIRNVTPEMLQQNNPVDEINNDLNNYMNLLSIQDSKSFNGVKLDNSQLKAVKRKIHDYENSFESQREFINQNLDNLNVEALTTVKSNIEGNYKNKIGEIQNGYNAYGIPVTPEAIRNEKLLEQQRIKEAEEFNKRNLNVFKRKVDKKNLEKLSDELLLDKTDDLNIIEPQYNNEKRKIATEIVSNATGKGYDYVQMVAKSGSQKFAKRRENLYDNLQDTEDRLNGADVVVGTGIDKYYDTRGLKYDNDEVGSGYDLAYQAWDDLANDNFYDELSHDDIINNALVNVDKEMRTGLKDILEHPNSYKDGKRVAKFAEKMSELIEELPKEVQGDYYNQLYDSLEKVQNYMDNKKTYNQKSPFRLKGEVKYNQSIQNNSNDKYFSQEKYEIDEETKRNYQEYSMLVERYLIDNKIPYSDQIRLGITPNALQEAGLSNIPLETTFSILDKMRSNKNNHLLRSTTIKKLPYLLHNPVAIFEGEPQKHPNSIVCILNAQNKINDPVIVSIDKNNINGTNEVNFITSGYGRTNLKNYLKKLKLLKIQKNIPSSLRDFLDPTVLISDTNHRFDSVVQEGNTNIITDKKKKINPFKKYNQSTNKTDVTKNENFKKWSDNAPYVTSKEAINYDEIQSKFEQEYIDREQISEDEARLSSDIDKHLKKQLGRNKIYFGKAPAILQNFGVPNLAMYMPQNKYDSSTGRLKVDGNIHNISDNVMKKIPTLLSDPIMIAYPTDESNYKGNSRLVASLNEVDNDGKPINVIIDYDWTGNRVNIIPTVYGREEFENYVNKCFKENKIVYTDEKNLLSHISKVQFPRGNSKGYNTIITDKGDLFKSSKKYSQEKTKKPSPFVRKDEPIVRGSLTIDSKTGKAIIDVLKSGDESTIPHELAHFYMNAVETLAQKDNTRAQKELEEINNWLGKQADIEYTQDELIEFDEKFARGFEAYLREGIAPTDNLGRVFIKFRNWLRDIYKSAEDLDVPMNEDTKKFFDRIFTTDKEYSQLYKKNFRMQEKIKEKEKSPFVRKMKVENAMNEAKKIYDRAVIPIDTMLERINPKLKTKLRKHTAETNVKIQENLERIKPFLDKMKKLDKETQSALDLALKNNKRITIDDILDKNGMAEDFAEVRHLLDDMYSDAVAAGIDVNYLSEYFPRTPKKGYENKYLQFIEDKFNGLKPDVFESLFGISKEEYSKTLRMLRDKDPHNVWTTEDKAKFINNAIKGYNDRNILKLHTPGNLKFERKIGQLDEELNAFYEDSMTALMGYVIGVQELIATKEFFGGENSEIAKIRTKMKNKNKMIQEVRKRPVSQAKAKEIARLQYEMAPLQAKLEIIKDSGSKEEKEALKKKINRLQEQIDYFEKANPFMVKNIVIKRLKGDLENFKNEIKSILGKEEDDNYSTYINNSIGMMVLEMEQEGLITKEEEDTLKEILKARFNPTNMHVACKTVRDLTYGFTMNDIQNAITQVGDLSFTMYKYGVKNTVKGIMDRYDISKDDIGLSEIAYEFSDPGFLQKYIKDLFKIEGLSAIDGFGKNTSINASLHDAKEKIQKNDEEINKRLSDLFENEAEQVKQDILDGKITTNVKIFAFDRLADLQPISADQQTIYQSSGSSPLKLAYTLKSYSIKAIDIARNDITNNIIKGVKTGNKELIVKGLKNAVRMQIFLFLFGIPKDALKDLMSNREINVLDSLLDNLIPLQNVSRYTVNKIFSNTANWFNPKKKYKADPIYVPVLEFLFSGLSVADALNEPYGLVTRIPLIGRSAYNWWLKKDDKKLVNPLPSPFGKKKKRKAS